MKGRVLRNTEGVIRAIDEGNGICKMYKEGPDVLEIIPVRGKKRPELITVGTLALFIGIAVALIMMAPAFGVMLMSLVAWTLFAAIATGEGEE